MGAAYARDRNHDHGVGRHDAVSRLSPYLRRRLILEQDAAAAAVAAHGREAAEKFIQEVVWRGYFKGWLERRSEVWRSYTAGVAADLSAVENDGDLRDRLWAAESGRSGIDCFDHWADELIETGYLHNHARMWFASIWIFTLKLPWRLGADFFHRHLIDGDAASNTLSWRWVAGLHTRGKAYEAKAWNIERFTGGRFRPDAGELASPIRSLEGEEPDGLAMIEPVPDVRVPQTDRPSILLITEEDCRPDDFHLEAYDLRAVAAVSCAALRSPRPVSDLVSDWDEGALSDTIAHLGRPSHLLDPNSDTALAGLMAHCGADQIVTPYVPVGPARDWLVRQMPELAAQGGEVRQWRRRWDDAIWPHATAGFFKVKAKIPKILQSVGIC